MKSVSDDKGELFDTNFKAFLYTNNKNQDLKSIRPKFKREDLLAKARYETYERMITIKHEKVNGIEKISFYNIFDSIDKFSREIILSELKPKDITIFLGNEDHTLIETIEKLSKLNIKSKIINSYMSENIIVKNNIINVKFDSSILQNMNCVYVKEYGYIYNLKNNLLKVKRKRNEIVEVIIGNQMENKKIPLLGDNKDIDGFYSKSDLKLINIKRDLTKILNEKFYMTKNSITDINNQFKLSIKDNQLILEGELNPLYLRVRNCIYTNLINLED